jgi:hypothetical protein
LCVLGQINFPKLTSEMHVSFVNEGPAFAQKNLLKLNKYFLYFHKIIKLAYEKQCSSRFWFLLKFVLWRRYKFWFNSLLDDPDAAVLGIGQNFGLLTRNDKVGHVTKCSFIYYYYLLLQFYYKAMSIWTCYIHQIILHLWTCRIHHSYIEYGKSDPNAVYPQEIVMKWCSVDVRVDEAAVLWRVAYCCRPININQQLIN